MKNTNSNPECCNCGKQYSITPIERRYLREQDLSAPRLCRACRAQRVEDAHEEDPRPRLMVGK